MNNAEYSLAHTIEKKILSLTGLESFRESKVHIQSFFEIYFEKIKLQHPALKIITIAGTNGKGHVANVLDWLCSSNEIKAIKWTSPHICACTERISIQSKAIKASKLDEVLDKCLESIKALELSYYEAFFLCLCEVLIQEDSLDVLILEVGLGGRLDATNFFTPDITCITSISRDHTHILGNSLKAILKEKVAIAEKGCPHYSMVSSEYLKKIEKNYCLSVGSKYKNFSDKNLNYVESNNLLAWNVFNYLFRDKSNNISELKNANKGMGRLQELSLSSINFILNGTHNLDGIRESFRFYQQSKISFDSILLSFSARDKRELDQMIQVIQSYPCCYENLILTYFEHPRAVALGVVQLLAKERKIHCVNSSKFFDTIKTKKNVSKPILITGSNYFVGHIIQTYF